MQYPIYIPSKGRFENMRTVKLLLANGIYNFFIVVEKKEYREYVNRIQTSACVLPMPGSDYGTSTPARNFCIEHAKKAGFKKLWMLDDDITSIFEHVQGKKKDTKLAEIFTHIEVMSDRDKKIKAVGITTSASFLKSITKPYVFNTSLTSVYLLTIEEGIRFRGTMLVDMDYQLQLLRRGFGTVKHNDCAFSFITPTKIRGGYYEVYTNDEKRLAAIQEFLKYNPDVDPTIVRNSTGFYVLKNLGKIWRKFK